MLAVILSPLGWSAKTQGVSGLVIVARHQNQYMGCHLAAGISRALPAVLHLAGLVVVTSGIRGRLSVLCSVGIPKAGCPPVQLQLAGFVATAQGGWVSSLSALPRIQK